MSADQKEQWEESADALKRYPEPDYSKPGTVAVVGLDGDRPVGYLVHQGRALAWFTSEGYDRGWGYGIRLLVEEILQRHAREDETAATAWAHLMESVPVVQVYYEDTPLSAFVDSLRAEWR